VETDNPGQEHEQSLIEVKYWSSLRELAESERESDEDLFESFYGEDGFYTRRGMLNDPVVTIYSECDGIRESLFVGRATVGHLNGILIRQILESLHCGGSYSSILKTDGGKYLRENGSVILD
jgi:hypothetical protein